MEETYDNLIETLEESVKKNGEKPLTNKWLLNILKKVRGDIEKNEKYDLYPDYEQ
jgi:hypothetical protein